MISGGGVAGEDSQPRGINWGEIYAHLITVTGWTWEYIGEYMTFPRLNQLCEYWKNTPPLHITGHRIAYALGAVPSATASGQDGVKMVEEITSELPDVET